MQKYIPDTSLNLIKLEVRREAALWHYAESNNLNLNFDEAISFRAGYEYGIMHFKKVGEHDHNSIKNN